MQNTQNIIARFMLSSFFCRICKKKRSAYILKPCREIDQRFEESQRRGKFGKKLETF